MMVKIRLGGLLGAPAYFVLVGLALFSSACSVQAVAGEKQVYRCPGNLYTDTLSAKEAAAKGCKTLEGAPITILQSAPIHRDSKAAAGNSNNNSSTTTASPRPDLKIDPTDQRSRDSDARRILAAELKKEEDALAALKKDYNNGEPERKGDEKNYQKYIERAAEMKAAVTRKEADIDALKRELAKLPAAPSAP